MCTHRRSIFQHSLSQQIFKLDKFEGGDFKYDDTVFKFHPKIIQIRHFWSQIYSFSFFNKMSQFGKSDGTHFKYMIKGVLNF